MDEKKNSYQRALLLRMHHAHVDVWVRNVDKFHEYLCGGEAECVCVCAVTCGFERFWLALKDAPIKADLLAYSLLREAY